MPETGFIPIAEKMPPKTFWENFARVKEVKFRIPGKKRKGKRRIIIRWRKIYSESKPTLKYIERGSIWIDCKKIKIYIFKNKWIEIRPKITFRKTT